MFENYTNYLSHEALQEQEYFPDQKITDYVVDIQVKTGLKKKNFFFERVMTYNKDLLELDLQKIEKRVSKIKPFEDLYKKIEADYK